MGTSQRSPVKFAEQRQMYFVGLLGKQLPKKKVEHILRNVYECL
jgi:hypothetical protein